LSSGLLGREIESIDSPEAEIKKKKRSWKEGSSGLNMRGRHNGGDHDSGTQSRDAVYPAN